MVFCLDLGPFFFFFSCFLDGVFFLYLFVLKVDSELLTDDDDDDAEVIDPWVSIASCMRQSMNECLDRLGGGNGT